MSDTFKLGDRVRITRGLRGLGEGWWGITGQLVESSDVGMYPYRVQFDVPTKGARSLHVFADELELIEEPNEHLPNITVYEERTIIVHVGTTQQMKLTPGEAEALRVRLGQVL